MFKAIVDKILLKACTKTVPTNVPSGMKEYYPDPVTANSFKSTLSRL